MLLENSTVEKVQELDSHVGVAISGLAADARNLVDHARVECANHKVRTRRGAALCAPPHAAADCCMAVALATPSPLPPRRSLRTMSRCASSR